FGEGFASGTIVTTAGTTLLFTFFTAAFHTPHTLSGLMPAPPCCQSPARLPGFTVTSVRYSAGQTGRPPPAASSLPDWSPEAMVVPRSGLAAHAGEPSGDSG